MATNDVNPSDTFEQWRLKTNLINANANVLASNILSLEATIATGLSGLSNVAANVAFLQTNLAIVNSNVVIVKGDIANLFSNLAIVNSNVAIVRGNISDITSNLTRVYSNQANTDSNVATIQQQIVSGIGATTVRAITAGETVNVGNVINIYNNTGAFNVRNAKCLPGYEAHGYVLSNVIAGQPANVYMSGINSNVTGLSPGYVFLSSSLGRVSQTAPTLSGNVVQRLGYAVHANAYLFNFDIPVTLT